MSQPAPGWNRGNELRHATLLFCDLVDSTLLANRLDLEDFREVSRTFEARVADVCRRQGGYVLRILGDGAFMAFGYPRAEDDAAEAAVHAGLLLVEEVRALRPLPEVTLALRVGIASGTAVMGELIDVAVVKEEAVAGPVANLAARLAGAGPANGVLIANATRRLVGRHFEYRDLGRLVLKGFNDTEHAWHVLGRSAIASRYEAGRDVDSISEMVGRSGPLEELRSGWREVALGRGRAVVLVGEPGIGKSRLARAARDFASQDGARLVEFDCTPRNKYTPLYPVTVVLRKLAGMQPEDTEAERAGRATALLKSWFRGGRLRPERVDEAMAYLGPLFGLTLVATGESAERVRERSISLLLEIVEELARDGAMFLLCEDLHWADASTLTLMRQLCSRIETSAILVLMTTRPEPEAPDLADMHAGFMTLDALDGDAAADLVRLVTQGRPLERSAIDLIVSRGEGVPLYLEELARSAREALDHAGTAPGHGSVATIARIPDKLQAVIQARLDRLGELKQIAQAASVIGREFPLRLLEELLPERRAEITADIARLANAGLLVEQHTGSNAALRFGHALIHDAVYQTLLRADRQRLHGQVADVLVRDFKGQPEATPGVLSHHFAGANRFEEFARCLLAASVDTAARAAYAEAIGHSRAALAKIDQISDPFTRTHLELQLSTQLALGLAATQGYAAPEVEQAYQKARALCTAGDADPVALFPIVRGMATFFIVRCKLRSADELSDQCVRLAVNAGRYDLHIEALTARGYTSVYLGRLAAGRAELERCIALYETHDGGRFVYPSAQDPATAALSMLATIAWLEGRVGQSTEIVQRALAHARELQRPFDVAYAECYAAMLCNLQRRFALAFEHANSCVDIAKKHGFEVWLAAGTMQALIASASLTPSMQATATLRTVLEMFFSAGAENDAPYFFWGLARGLKEVGDPSGAREAVKQGLARAETTGESYLTAELLLLAADLDDDAARAHERRLEALALSERQGAATLALRAALALHDESGTFASDDPATMAARNVLEGLVPYPSPADWVRDTMHAICRTTGSGWRVSGPGESVVDLEVDRTPNAIPVPGSQSDSL
jgi:class 3 adenylate cyclase